VKLDYTTSIIIDLPRARVIDLFDDPANLAKWQKGLQSFEHLSGEAGKPGARSKLVFQMGKRRMEMIETVTRRDLPDAFDGTYEVDGVLNIVENRFTEVGPDKTLLETRNIFEMKGFMMSLMGWLMPGMFRKQSEKYAEAFKAFAENGVDVRSA
jgi:carbon monoxide dehydrogenase subunit G